MVLIEIFPLNPPPPPKKTLWGGFFRFFFLLFLGGLFKVNPGSKENSQQCVFKAVY